METLHYCAMPLARNSKLRQDSDWLNSQFAADNRLLLTMWSQQHLVTTTAVAPQLVYLGIACAALVLDNAAEIFYLGQRDDRPVFAADLDRLEAKRVAEIIDKVAPNGEFRQLRDITTLLDKEQASICAFAKAIGYWHQQNKFCARCGTATTSLRGGHMRRCDSCHQEIFPRINPAVIMLVEQRNPQDGIAKCLLGRHRNLPQQMYSTLAGYVDPGESLEQAVIREVSEEAGLWVTNPTYIASQPWSFPASMMLGFRAKTDQTEIVIDDHELEDARWFSREQLKSFGEYGDQNSLLTLPRTDSIARVLIDMWRQQT